MSKPPARLVSNNVSFTLGANEEHAGHPITVNIGVDPKTDRIVELAFCEAGKIGEGLHLIFAELGLKMSRILQGRDPETGAESGS
jgi:hypothetical protein